MMEPITQFILLAGGVGTENWANILVIAVMAILWLVAGLVRMIGKKGPQQEQPEPEGSTGQPRRPGESWHQRLARKAEEIQRRLEEQAGVREPGRPRPPAREAATQSPQAPGGKISVRPGQRGESGMVSERPQPQPSTQREHQVARQREAQRAVAAAGQYATASKLEPVPPVTSEPMREPTGFEPAAVIDDSDPDVLKKAVLHYEILGKPLALRESAEEIAAF